MYTLTPYPTNKFVRDVIFFLPRYLLRGPVIPADWCVLFLVCIISLNSFLVTVLFYHLLHPYSWLLICTVSGLARVKFFCRPYIPCTKDIRWTLRFLSLPPDWTSHYSDLCRRLYVTSNNVVQDTVVSLYLFLPNSEMCWWVLLLCIWEVSVSNLGHDMACPEFLCWVCFYFFAMIRNLITGHDRFYSHVNQLGTPSYPITSH